MIRTLRHGLAFAARLRSDRSGATAVEFALVAIPFLMLIFAIIELGLVFLVELPEADSPQGHRVLQALGVIRQRGLARLVLLRPRIGNADTAPPPGAPWHFDASADSLEAAVAWVDPKAR